MTSFSNLSSFKLFHRRQGKKPPSTPKPARRNRMPLIASLTVGGLLATAGLSAQTQDQFNKMSKPRQDSVIFHKILDNPCGCPDENGNAPPTLRFPLRQLRRALKLNPAVEEILPEDLNNLPDSEQDIYFNPHGLEPMIGDDEEFVPLGNSPFFEIKKRPKVNQDGVTGLENKSPPQSSMAAFA